MCEMMGSGENWMVDITGVENRNTKLSGYCAFGGSSIVISM